MAQKFKPSKPEPAAIPQKTKAREILSAFLERVFKKSASSDEAEDKISVNYISIIKWLTVMILSIVFSKLEFAMGVYPFGIALMCAITKNLTACWTGAMVGSLLSSSPGGGWVYPLVYTLIPLSRYVLGKWLGAGGGVSKSSGTDIRKRNSRKITREERRRIAKTMIAAYEGHPNKNVVFRENVYIRMAVACTASCIVSAYNVIAGGYLYFDLFAAVFAAVMCPIVTFVYCGITERYMRHTPYCEAGWAAMLFTTVLAVKDIPFFGLNLGVIVSFAAALYVSWSGGIMRGGITGLICGIACEPLFAPVYAIAGMAAGIFWNISAFAAVSAACVLGLCWGIYTSGFAALSKLVPEMIGVSVIVSPIIKYAVIPKLNIFSRTVPSVNHQSEAAEMMEIRQKSASVKLKTLSETFEAMSGVFYNLSDRLRRPGISELRQICETSCEGHCARCNMNPVCWERESAETTDALNRMTKSLYSSGRVSAEVIPDYLISRCYNMDKIIDDINVSYARTLETAVKSDKTEVFAVDYEAIAKLLRDASDIVSGDMLPDGDLSRKLKRSLQYLDFYASDVTVYGQRSKLIKANGLDLSRVRMGAEDIRKAVENICGSKMTHPEFAIDGENVSMTVRTARTLGTDYTKCTAAQNPPIESTGAAVNGDIINIFEGTNDKFYTLISDGMGSGREAALTSQVCAVFLERMLTSGVSVPLALQMLNNFVRTKGIECSATIDLMELDMITGEACFIKSGAAPSFIKRGGNLFKLHSKTVPIGIIRALDAEQIKFDIEEGDVIVMLSDGVVQSFEECGWLLEMLSSEERWDSLEVMAERIMLTAAEHANGRSDDMTVGIINVRRG